MTTEELSIAMTIEIPVRDTTERIFFTQSVGQAEYGGEKMLVSQTIAGGSLIFNFRGRSYMVDTEDLIAAIWTTANKETENDK
jgi:hypothetical protein